jgi:predicted metal-dependent HD superfamily phosphohydrolase
MLLKSTFFSLLSNYTINEALKLKCWQEIEIEHSKKNRHYHTLSHLENLLKQLSAVKNNIQNWNSILFCIYYHDFVYNVFKKDNEEKSASFAEKRMLEIGVPLNLISICKNQIIATKQHQLSADSDTNYFLDADLSILGMPWDEYEMYAKNVRKEYRYYPSLLYNSGRKKILNHFLSMETIFKTNYFFEKFEFQSKQNIQKEIDFL